MSWYKRTKGGHARRRGRHERLAAPLSVQILRNDILSSASVWNGIPKEQLIGRLRERG